MLAHLARPLGAISLPALFAFVAAPALRQNTTITGTVRGDGRAPLAGAVVQIAGTRHSSTTTEDGRYRLIVPAAAVDTMADSVTLVARRIGFMPQSRRVARTSGSVSVDFVLAPATTALSEVVVTSTGASAPVSAKTRPSEALARRESRSRADFRDAAASTPSVASERSAAVGSSRGRGERGDGRRQDPPAGILTAAVWDDAANWQQYQRFLGRAEEHSWNPWGLELGQTRPRPVRGGARPPRSPRRALDLGFLVDATGSMGDELTFLQTELKDIVRRVRGTEPDLDIRVSVVFYRDRGDDFITRSLPFTSDVDSAVSFISGTRAGGGGDFPEDMNAGLEAMMRQRWSRDAIPQMLFLLADAPPQQYRGADYTYHEAIHDAAANGIAIYPVAASGVDKPTEFLFRAMAVMTGGKYVFLTDDSGVGNPHEVPDITGYTVEKLNDLMVGEIRAFVAARTGGRRVAEVR
jgi:Mg-chelatase subunit ChlD